MDHPLRRLIVIAFLVSITFSSCAQNETVSEDDAERIICLPGTTQCNNPHPGNNPKLNEETIADSPVQASAEDDDHENACIPGTTQCNNPHPGDNPKLNEEATTDSLGQASGEEDDHTKICIPGTTHCENPQPGNPKLNEETVADSPVEASDEDAYPENDCIPGTTHCNNPHPGDNPKLNEEATADSPGQASGEEDASKSEPSIICDPITKLCEGPSTRIVCNPITHICTQPKPNSFVSESDIEEQTKDDSVIHEEKEKISPLVCDPHTGNCQDPHHSFGVAQPRDEVA